MADRKVREQFMGDISVPIRFLARLQAVTLMPANALTWGLVVPTYNREDVLLRCLRLGAAQTRPPLEIIVVDSSPGWKSTQERVLREIAPLWPGIRWRYDEAERRSSASQRNQGVRAATADIVFLFDDDSLMYPDCAAEIMRVYEADSGRSVVGVNATNVPAPPDASPESQTSAPTEFTTAKNYGPLARWVRRILRADDIFIPYDRSFPAHPMPTAVAALAVDRWPMGAGWGMSFRREICLAEPFEEILINYAAGEDSDMSYRATRRGVYVGARHGKLCHLGSPTGRVPTFIWAVSNMLNPVALHGLYSTDRGRSRMLHRRMLSRRVLISAAKDVYYRRWTMPTTRAALLSLSKVGTVFRKSEHELRTWYPQFQAALYKRAQNR
jgi:glycosyltransferase involved in cell wall biosynthesis